MWFDPRWSIPLQTFFNRRLIIAQSKSTPLDSLQIKEIVVQSLDDDKAQEIVTIDLNGITSVADYFVIASGSSSRHVGAMADHLNEKLKAAGHNGISIEGQENCDWVLVDAFDVVIHLFKPEVRDFYNLEKMWDMAEITKIPQGQAAPAEQVVA